MKYGIITGSGMEDLFIQFIKKIPVRTDTKYGIVKGFEYQIGDETVVIIPRHGVEERISPSNINYRGIIQSMKMQKVDRIISLNSVGIINTDHSNIPLKVGSLALVSDFIDFTKNRISSFEDCSHIDMSEPFDLKLRRKIKKMCENEISGKEVFLSDNVVYVCTEGSRFETKSEINMFRIVGADVVGMTIVPEVILANELKIPYASIAICTNFAAGVQDFISFEEVKHEVNKIKYQIDVILQRLVFNDPKYNKDF